MFPAHWPRSLLRLGIIATLLGDEFFLSTSSATCPAFEPLRRAIFGTNYFIFYYWSTPWDMARLLGLRGVPPRPHPPEGVG